MKDLNIVLKIENEKRAEMGRKVVFGRLSVKYLGKKSKTKIVSIYLARNDFSTIFKIQF